MNFQVVAGVTNLSKEAMLYGCLTEKAKHTKLVILISLFHG